MKVRDRNLQGYDSSGTGQEDTGNSARSSGIRKTRRAGQRSSTRVKTLKNKRQKTYEDDADDTDVDIPKQFLSIFASFKKFIDDMFTDGSPEPVNEKGGRRRTEKAGMSSKTSNKDSEPNQSYAGESQSKFLHDAENQSASNYQQQMTGYGRNAAQDRAHMNERSAQSIQNQYGQNVGGPNNQDLLLQLLAAQASQAQSSQGYNQMDAMRGGDHMGNFSQMSNQQSMHANSSSLLLLQRIIQTTPEIQMLHQQEQLALLRIQQNIRAALTQNMGQDVISQLVLEYQKTQEQHQLNIQSAIQRKLTMILLKGKFVAVYF